MLRLYGGSEAGEMALMWFPRDLPISCFLSLKGQDRGKESSDRLCTFGLLCSDDHLESGEKTDCIMTTSSNIRTLSLGFRLREDFTWYLWWRTML